MSYSFSVKAATKAEAKTRVTEEFDKVVAAQPDHKHDSKQAQDAAEVFIDLLADDDTKHVSVSVTGSLSWKWDAKQAKVYTGTSVSIYASLLVP